MIALMRSVLAISITLLITSCHQFDDGLASLHQHVTALNSTLNASTSSDSRTQLNGSQTRQSGQSVDYVGGLAPVCADYLDNQFLAGAWIEKKIALRRVKIMDFIELNPDLEGDRGYGLVVEARDTNQCRGLVRLRKSTGLGKRIMKYKKGDWVNLSVVVKKVSSPEKYEQFRIAGRHGVAIIYLYGEIVP